MCSRCRIAGLFYNKELLGPKIHANAWEKIFPPPDAPVDALLDEETD